VHQLGRQLADVVRAEQAPVLRREDEA
jgi:hypothetical protein